MTKIQPPKGKGAPPSAQTILGNLDKPVAEGISHLNFRVSESFHKEFGIYAIASGRKTQTQLLMDAFATLKKAESGQ